MRRAAIANMRPKLAAAHHANRRPGQKRFPPGHGNFWPRTALRLALAKFFHRGADSGILHANDTGGEKSGILRSRDPDGERSDRDSGRHLRNREERIKTFQCARFDRHAEHREPGLRRNHAGQMSGAARARDDDLHAALRRFACEFCHQIRCAMRRDDAMFVRHTEIDRATRRNAASSPNPRRSP